MANLTPETLINTKLEVVVKNVKPIELTDLTLSLLAMGNNYERYVKANKLELGSNKPKLYVKEVRPGSHIFDIFASPETLVNAAYCAAAACQVPINYMEYANTVIGFASYLGDFFGFYLGKNEKKPENIEKKDLENGKQMLELVTKDGQGASIGFSAVQGNVTIVQNFYNYAESNAIQNGINRELKQDPTQKFYNQVVLRLEPIR
jgi:hypothetical protein